MGSLVLQKLVLFVLVLLHSWQADVQGAMRQMLVQGHSLMLLDEVGRRGASSTRDQKTRTVSTSSGFRKKGRWNLRIFPVFFFFHFLP